MTLERAMEEQKSESNQWRPETNAGLRGVRATRDALDILLSRTPSRHRIERTSMAFGMALFGDLDIKSLGKEKRSVLNQFFMEAMYFNRQLDREFPRAKKGAQSFKFIEDYWHLPQRVQKLKERGKKAGYSSSAMETIDDWFILNKVLSYASISTTREGKVNWKDYQAYLDNPTGSSDPPPQDLDKERKIFSQVRTVMEEFNADHPQAGIVTQAILLRALSSSGYAKTLLALTTDQNPQTSQARSGRSRRVTAMVMAAQLLDDAGSPVKDRKYEIPGMISSALKESELKNEQLMISQNDADNAVKLAREILRGCLETINIDPEHPIKLLTARNALALIGSGSSAIISRTSHGGSRYPAKTALRVLTELKKKASREEGRHVIITKNALEVSTIIA
ncbi:hypothetical protein ACFL0Y_03265 [Patescibacteria group bacterium]